jgi:nucleotide-binding universal stress UspA family protein
MKIVFAFDEDDSSKNALEIMQKHAKDINADVHIVASLMKRHFPQAGQDCNEADEVKEAEKNLEFAKQSLTNAGINCETHILARGLQPGEDIVKYAGEVNADFIALGIDRASRVGKMIFGSVAQYVVMEAACPVIIFK